MRAQQIARFFATDSADSVQHNGPSFLFWQIPSAIRVHSLRRRLAVLLREASIFRRDRPPNHVRKSELSCFCQLELTEIRANMPTARGRLFPSRPNSGIVRWQRSADNLGLATATERSRRGRL